MIIRSTAGAAEQPSNKRTERIELDGGDGGGGSGILYLVVYEVRGSPYLIGIGGEEWMG